MLPTSGMLLLLWCIALRDYWLCAVVMMKCCVRVENFFLVCSRYHEELKTPRIFKDEETLRVRKASCRLSNPVAAGDFGGSCTMLASAARPTSPTPSTCASLPCPALTTTNDCFLEGGKTSEGLLIIDNNRPLFHRQATTPSATFSPSG